jgi:hypothetical protein
MRIKLLFLTMAAVAQLTGMSVQSFPEDNPNTRADLQTRVPLISVSSLSDTEGVDVKNYLASWKKTSDGTWEKLIASDAQDNFPEKGEVTIRFKLLPNGELMSDSMVLEGRSGSVAFDRAVWSTLTNSRYAVLPSQFHGPYLELRALFSYTRQRKM